jgi:hypothetical protein
VSLYFRLEDELWRDLSHEAEQPFRRHDRFQHEPLEFSLSVAFAVTDVPAGMGHRPWTQAGGDATFVRRADVVHPEGEDVQPGVATQVARQVVGRRVCLDCGKLDIAALEHQVRARLS